MKWCLWCGERLRRNAFRSYNGWVHQDGSVYKTYVGTDGVERDDHCVLPTNDQKAAERMAEGHFQFAERLFCWCGYPITVEDIMTVDGERQVYLDGKTGAIINECPCCGDWSLDVNRLFRTESQQGHRTAKPRLGGN